MVFDSLGLRQVARELGEGLEGARVERVFMPAEATAVLEFGRPGAAPQVLLCWQPELARVHLAHDFSPEPGLHCALVDALRRYLRGARLAGVSQLGFDRVLRLDFLNAENLGPHSRCALVVEPIGRWANALLLDATDTLRGCARPVPAEVNRYRQLLPGEPYQPPPGQELPPLSEAGAEQLETVARAAPEAALGGLVRASFQGASPTLLGELWARTGLDPDAPAAGQPPQWAERLGQALRGLTTETDQPGAWVHCPAPGKTFAYPVRLVRPAAAEAVATLSAGLQQVAAELAAGERARQRRESLAAAAARGWESVHRRRQAREQAWQTAQEAGVWREYGEAILANLWRLSPGETEARLPLYTPEGEREMVVPLAPHLPPQELAQLYFRRYKKAQRAVAKLPRLLAADRREEQYLEGALGQLETADAADLAELEEELRRGGYLRRRRERPSREPRRDFHRLTREGHALWWGGTGLQNDRLLRAAAPEDLWLHVREGPGGHVVVRTGGQPQQVPETVRQEAARLAAGLSRRRGEGEVEVACTLVKHVRRPAGGPPGYVLYDHEATLSAAPLPSPPDEPEGA